MIEGLKELLERLEKADPDSFQNLTDLIERHIKNAENLNMILDVIPHFISLQTGEEEGDARNIIPYIMESSTPEEVCKVINGWIKESEKIKNEERLDEDEEKKNI